MFSQELIQSLHAYMPSVLDEQDSFFLILVGLYFVAIWGLLEIVFFIVVVFVLAPRLHQPSTPQPYPGDHKEFILRIYDAVDNLDSYTFEQYMSGFFLGADFSEILSDNVCSFMAWAMFSKKLEDLNKQEHFVVYDTYEEACRRHPDLRRIPKGYNSSLKHACMCLDPVPYIHRPLFMYVLVSLFEFLCNTYFLRAGGFQSLSVNGMNYWYKHCGNNNSSGDDTQEPIMFLHGISPGWSFYMSMVRSLGQNRSIILVDLDAIKIKSLCFTMPSPQQYADSVKLILRRHRIDRVSVVGHSFGSIAANWLVSRYPQHVSHLTLVDPVSMLLAFPDVAYSFVYRPPRSFSQWVMFLGASREITVSYMLHRQFWWYQNILWLEDVPDHIGVVVGLASEDQIIEPKVLQEYVQRCQEKRMLKAAGAEPMMVSMMAYPTPPTQPHNTQQLKSNTTSSSCGNGSGGGGELAAQIAQFYRNNSTAQRSKNSKSKTTKNSGGSSPKLGAAARQRRRGPSPPRSTSPGSSSCTASGSSNSNNSSNNNTNVFCPLSRANSYASLSRHGSSASLSRVSSSTSISSSVSSNSLSLCEDPELNCLNLTSVETTTTTTQTTTVTTTTTRLPLKTSTHIPGVWEHNSSTINAAFAAAGFDSAALISVDKVGQHAVSSTVSDNASTATTTAAATAVAVNVPAKAKDKVALIECVVWDEFVHGQILIPGMVQSHFIEKVHRNEKCLALKPSSSSSKS